MNPRKIIQQRNRRVRLLRERYNRKPENWRELEEKINKHKELNDAIHRRGEAAA